MDIREIAFETYQKSLNNNGFEGFENTEIKTQDMAFIKRLVMTTLRKQEFLKKVINKYSSKPMPQKMQPPHFLLIMGCAEALYFRTPTYAVVNSYVALAKKIGNKYSGGFINAILRKICNDKENILQAQNVPFFTKSFRQILQKDYTQKQISLIEKHSAQEPPLDITTKKDFEAWTTKLNGKLMPNNSIRIQSAGEIKQLPEYENGEWWVQDMASSLAVKTLKDIKGLKVLDLCAAPGGKTAQLINAGADVTALDISEKRLQTMQENLARLKMQTVKTICADANLFLQECKEKFDIILLDAPCSATGTLRRHPEIVHNRSIKDVEQCVGIQKNILENVDSCLKNGGILLYSVCSLAKDEGEKQIINFISTNPQYKIVPITTELFDNKNADSLQEMITEEGFIRCLPYHFAKDGGVDGFFIAKLKKEK